MERIKAGTFGRDFGKKDMVFCIIYCEEARPYIGYSEFTESSDISTQNKQFMHCPLVLLQARWDGKLGFPGGNVDPSDNSLEETILREIKEEINYDADPSRLIPFTTFSNDKRHITSFIYKVSEQELNKIFRQSFLAKHFGAENCGSIKMQIHELSVENLKKMVYSGTAGLELNALIEEKHLLIDKKMLQKAIDMAKPYFSKMKRDNGNNYFEEHILGTVEMAKAYPLEYQIVMALHDMLEDTPVTADDLRKEFPEFIVKAVESLTLDKDAIDMKAEVGKCAYSDLTVTCRYIDRLNNLTNTSFKYNKASMVEKMIFKTKAYFLPWFTEKQKARIMQELNRIESERGAGYQA